MEERKGMEDMFRTLSIYIIENLNRRVKRVSCERCVLFAQAVAERAQTFPGGRVSRRKTVQTVDEARRYLVQPRRMPYHLRLKRGALSVRTAMNLERLPLPAREEIWRLVGERIVVEGAKVNRLWISHTALGPEVLEGEGFWKCLHPEDRILLPPIVRRGQGRLFLRLRTPDGSWTPVWIFLHAEQEGDAYRVLSLYAFEVSEEVALEQLLEAPLRRDPLTGALNRGTFLDVLERYLEQRPRFLPILVMDIHRFHEINASYGVEMGDRVLVGVVARLREILPPEVPVARLGPDEFGVLLVGVSDLSGLLKTIDELDRSFEQPLENAEHLYVSLHMGVSIAPFDGEDAHNLVRRAELALASIKPMQEKGVGFYSRKMERTLVEDASLRSFLVDAVKNETLEVHYQPVLDLIRGKVVGVEALLRWHHPYGGTVPPLRFLPLAEKLGLMGALTRFVLRRSLRDVGDLPAPLWVSVNFSPSQFHSRQIQALVESTLEELGVNPERLVVEITEDTAMRDPLKTWSILRSFKQMGIHIALDDFGTGYSSMSHLMAFELDKIKLDRTFVTNLPENPKAFHVAQAIIQLAHTLETRAVAEGIETEDQLSLLREWGCDEGQGYLFARPMPMEELRTFLNGRV